MKPRRSTEFYVQKSSEGDKRSGERKSDISLNSENFSSILGSIRKWSNTICVLNVYDEGSEILLQFARSDLEIIGVNVGSWSRQNAFKAYTINFLKGSL